MKKISLLIPALFSVFDSFAIDPSGSRVDLDGGIDIPTPILIIILFVATIGCFAMGMLKNSDGKRDSPGMLWLGLLGIVGLTCVLGNL